MFRYAGARSIDYYAADALALFHELKCLVDLLQRHYVGDHRIDLYQAVHIPVDDPWRIGAAAGSAERCAAPHPPRHQLERTRRDFRTRRRHADDDALAPAAMAGLQRLTHHGGVAGAIERVVGTAAGKLDEVRDQIAAHFLRTDEMGHAEARAPFLLVVVDVDANDHLRADELQALDDIEADSAEPEHDRGGAGLDFGRVDHRADSRRHAATAITSLVERCVRADLCHRNFGQHRVVR